MTPSAGQHGHTRIFYFILYFFRNKRNLSYLMHSQKGETTNRSARGLSPASFFSKSGRNCPLGCQFSAGLCWVPAWDSDFVLLGTCCSPGSQAPGKSPLLVQQLRTSGTEGERAKEVTNERGECHPPPSLKLESHFFIPLSFITGYQGL